ncbi:MAG: hypothetical protein C5B58_01265 [Acidobacteria bacterium]|nr:MAG: hypothetical protein C5B58_01265 [Acidobacteriota bacterium]
MKCGRPGRFRAPRRIRKLPLAKLLLPLFSATFLLLSPVIANAGTSGTIDLFPSFLRCCENSPLGRQERAELFSEDLIQAYPEIYHRPGVFMTDPKTLGSYLDEVKRYLPAMKKIHARLQGEFESIEQSFCTHFPDFNLSRVKVYLMLSLFRFDGKIPHDDPNTLFLALDGLAKFHGADANLGVILSHELFHLYHFQVNALPATTDDIPLYRQIWQEGLATYVSTLLNPSASLSEVLLDPQLARDGPKYISQAAHNLLTQLESTDDAPAARYLSYRRGSAPPSRMGYLVGYRVAAHLAATQSLEELSRLRGQRLLKLFRREVQAMASP